MSRESERPIEKQLRDHAARRRAAAGDDAFALHPVTRSALQVEVEREFGRSASRGGPTRTWLTGWWPRLAFAGGAFLVVLAIAVIPWRKPAEVGDLAKVETATALAPAESKALPADKLLVDGPAVAESSEQRLRANAVSQAGQRQQFQFTNTRLQSSTPPSVSAPPVAPNPTRQASAPVRAGGDPVRRDLAAMPALSSPGQPAPASVVAPLQGDFQVVIQDGQIALVDADQSSYSGRLEPVDPASVGAPGPQRSLSFEDRYYKFVQNGVPQVVPLAAQFVLNGTNRATQLPVQIVGQMVTRTQAVPTQVSGGGGKQAIAPPGVFLQINATATVNGGAPVQIDASAQPQ